MLPPAGSLSLLFTLAFGFVLGIRHALDADHLVAISTIVGRHRSIWRASMVGAWWGLGHTASLLVASIFVVGLRQTIPLRVTGSLALVVGLMLVVLGLDLSRRIYRGELTLHAHLHDGHSHLHAHVPVADGAPAIAPPSETHHHAATRPFLIGVVHGLAGSGALTVVVVSTIASPLAGLGYVAVFGAGTLVGMFVMSALVGLPFVLAARAASGISIRIQGLAAVSSVVFGVWYSLRSISEIWP